MMKAVVREPVALGTAVALLTAAALAWWLLIHPNHAAMDMGLWEYIAAWTVMMAAMMLPSAVPMIALYANTSKSRVSIVAFASVYLAVWSIVGVPGYFLAAAVQQAAMVNARFVAALP